MNRWIWPGAIVGGVAVATLAATLIGPQPLPTTPFTVSETRVSVVCPAFESPTATVRVAALSTGSGLRTATVARPTEVTDATGLRVVRDPGVPLRVSALLPNPFGATTSVAAEAGGDRGLSAAACTAPATEHWFTGVDIRTIAQSEVVVANLDGTPASVDLTAFGEKGRFGAPRGVRVEGNSVETISLGNLARLTGPVTIQVSSSDGRVAAFVRQRTWQGDAPLGADWLDATTAPATELVVPGVPAGEGARTLVLTNPGDRTATVAVGGLGKDGPVGLAGAEQVEVPPQTTRTVDLETTLDSQPGALTLTATQPVTAGMWLDTGGSQTRHDPAYTVATRPLPSDAVWALALGKGATTVLQLANPGAAEAAVTVTAGTTADDAQPQQVSVPAGSIVEVALARAATNVVRVQTGATDLRGALVSTDRLGKVHGLAVIDLAAEETHGDAPAVFDPHAGS
ncbi:MAG: DUF5719 family protein [Actinobacteria bacterium]|nr:DUF5719 family protein [Actinomycetota bacterium]